MCIMVSGLGFRMSSCDFLYSTLIFFFSSFLSFSSSVFFLFALSAWLNCGSGKHLEVVANTP